MKRMNEYLTLDGFMGRFSARERAEIEANARKLAADMMTFSKLRKARNLTQVEMAKLLGIAQENVSRIEHRSDMLISTMRSYVRAMGGDLRLVALFPDQKSIEVRFHDLREPSEDRHPKEKPRRRPVAQKSRVRTARKARNVAA
jgi:transcriptional regulator with XRE-family HTH domain